MKAASGMTGSSAVLIAAAATGLLLFAGGLLGADGWLAQAEPAGGGLKDLLTRAVGMLDLLAGKEISSFLLGPVLVLAALASNGLKRRLQPWSGGFRHG